MTGVLEPEVGMRFPSFLCFDEYLKAYSSQEKQVFTVRNSTSIKNSNLKGVDLNLKYEFATYACKFYGTPRIATSGERRSYLYKKGCLAHIKIKLTEGKTELEISQVNLSHQGHEESKVFYKAIPENRRLSPASKAEVEDLMKYDANRKLIKNKLATEKDKFLTIKDLANIKSRMKSNNQNELPAFIKKLYDNGCDVSICQDKNQNFKGVYFSTADMRNSMKAWSHIVFIDGTHKLFSLNLTLIILLVQDNNGRGEIVGAAVVVSEDRATLKWIALMFKEQNSEACQRIKCFMGDKDMTERDVLKEVFPGIPIYLCLFHTLRSFARALNKKTMKLNNKTHDVCQNLLQQLAYSSSETAYKAHLQDLKDKAPEPVYDYFLKNWHGIREEWTWYSVVQGNRNNLTNNRLESFNKQIKQVVNRHSSLCQFADRFFQFVQSQNQETDMKTAKQFLKVPITVFTPSDAEHDYLVFLVEDAFREVQRELRLHQAVVIEQCDETTRKCIVRFVHQQIETTPTDCGCRFHTSMALPCKHMFAVRERFKLPLYEESICHQRWTKHYTKINQRAFRDSEVPSIDIAGQMSTVVHTVPQKKYRTIGEKRRALKSITEQIVDDGSNSTGLNFMNKIDTLNQVVSAWRDGFEVHIDVLRTKAKENDKNNTVGASFKEVGVESMRLNSEMNALSIADNTIATISEIKMPSRPRTRGGPSGLNSTTTGFYPRRQASKRNENETSSME